MTTPTIQEPIPQGVLRPGVVLVSHVHRGRHWVFNPDRPWGCYAPSRASLDRLRDHMVEQGRAPSVYQPSDRMWAERMTLDDARVLLGDDSMVVAPISPRDALDLYLTAFLAADDDGRARLLAAAMGNPARQWEAPHDGAAAHSLYVWDGGGYRTSVCLEMSEHLGSPDFNENTTSPMRLWVSILREEDGAVARVFAEEVFGATMAQVGGAEGEALESLRDYAVQSVVDLAQEQYDRLSIQRNGAVASVGRRPKRVLREPLVGRAGRALNGVWRMGGARSSGVIRPGGFLVSEEREPWAFRWDGGRLPVSQVRARLGDATVRAFPFSPDVLLGEFVVEFLRASRARRAAMLAAAGAGRYVPDLLGGGDDADDERARWRREVGPFRGAVRVRLGADLLSAGCPGAWSVGVSVVLAWGERPPVVVTEDHSAGGVPGVTLRRFRQAVRSTLAGLEMDRMDAEVTVAEARLVRLRALG